MESLQLTSHLKFWIICILGVLAYSLLFTYTNSINNLDELHYLSLAWEMHKQHYYLLPIALGHPDIQKPPLLYWLINLGWSVFGYTTTWPLMLIALINVGCLFVTYRIAQKLFPENALIAQMSVVVLATGVFWFHFFNRIRFDGLMTLFTIMYINFSINIYRHSAPSQKLKWSLLAGICLGLGFLAKGAAILIFAIPFYFLLPRFETHTYPLKKWAGHFVLTLLIALVILACWAVPLYLSLGKQLIDTMFVKQQHSRILLTHHLGELPTLLLSFLPWTLLPLTLLNLKRLITIRTNASDSSVGNPPQHAAFNRHFWLLTWTVLLSGLFFTFFVLMHVKRYLLPLYPLFAIMLAYILCLDLKATTLKLQNRILCWAFLILGIGLIVLSFLHSPHLAKLLPPSYDYAIWGGLLVLSSVIVSLHYWRIGRLPCDTCKIGHPYARANHTQRNELIILICLISVGLIVGVIGINGIFTRRNDVFLEKLAQQMKTYQDQGIPQANLISGGYQAFDFKGHLNQPLPLFDENSAIFKQWVTAHPNGILYFSFRKSIPNCMAANAYRLKGSDRIITIISVKNYQSTCMNQ